MQIVVIFVSLLLLRECLKFLNIFLIVLAFLDVELRALESGHEDLFKINVLLRATRDQVAHLHLGWLDHRTSCVGRLLHVRIALGSHLVIGAVLRHIRRLVGAQSLPSNEVLDEVVHIALYLVNLLLPILRICLVGAAVDVVRNLHLLVV